jgi:hypothetical protein
MAAEHYPNDFADFTLRKHELWKSIGEIFPSITLKPIMGIHPYDCPTRFQACRAADAHLLDGLRWGACISCCCLLS